MELTLMAGFIVMMDCWKGLAEMSTSSTSSLFWNKETDQGFSSVGIVLALVNFSSFVFTCAKVYEINTGFRPCSRNMQMRQYLLARKYSWRILYCSYPCAMQ